MKITFLGGTCAIGKSAVAVKTSETTVVLDYGVAMDGVPSFPMHIAPRDVDLVIVTHAHLDHSGAVPLFHVSRPIPVYATPVTFDLMELLLNDFLRLSGYYLPYEYLDMKTMFEFSRPLRYGERVSVKDVEFTLVNAGHIPGSAQILLEAEGKRILYTGDINDVNTCLLEGAFRDYGPLDAVIIESTYADEEHPERDELEKEFVESVLEVVERGGKVLVPAFSVGRSQEVLTVLTKWRFDYPMAVDGMAVDATQIFLKHVDWLRDPELFKKAVRTAKWVSGWKDRRLLLKKECVIIAPAGMLKGGTAVFYAEKLAKSGNNAIYLVSYQIPGTPGRELLEKGRFVIGGKIRKVKAKVKRFDFSSHIGMSGFKRLLKELKGNPVIYAVHGEPEKCSALCRYARELGLEAHVPKVGDVYEV
ncbi:MBL fold metallo-hydrolase [Candidatus Bathyarchaeota archaeon]|nr:MBL fold metallo-hydrolase [Candidatus Bathyarchaeota archaeon]RJS74986.1 MAG: MBL fold metallo-hydrolase [Candidatus Bathyarchaeota archaeon]